MDKKIEKGPNLSLSAIIGSFQKLTGAFLSTLDGSKEDLFFVPRSVFQDIFSGNYEGLKFFRSYFDSGKIANTRGTSSFSRLINSLKIHSFCIML